MSLMVLTAHLRFPLGLGIRDDSSSFLILTMLQPCSYQLKIFFTVSASFSLMMSFLSSLRTYPKHGLEKAGESALAVLFLIPGFLVMILYYQACLSIENL